MTRAVRRVALYGFFGNGNLGNDATFETVLRWLESEHPNLDLRCITIAPASIKARFGIPAYSLTSRLSAFEGKRVVAVAAKAVGRVLDLPHTYATVGAVDVVIVPGMGVLEETLGVRPWGLPFWLFATAAACRLRRRHFLLLGVGADRTRHVLTRWLYLATVKLASHVSYRDDRSAAAMVEAGADQPDAIVPDLVFAYPGPGLTEPDPNLLVVGVMAYYGRDDDPNDGADIRRRYIETMSEALAELVQAGNRVILVGGDAVDVDVARELSDAVHASVPELRAGTIVIRELSTFTELTDVMAAAAVIVASRFHNLICALRLTRPVISVGYAEKNRDLMRAMDLDAYCQHIETLDAPLLVRQIKAAAANGPVIGEQIRRGSADYAEAVHALFAQIGEAYLGARSGRVD